MAFSALFTNAFNVYFLQICSHVGCHNCIQGLQAAAWVLEKRVGWLTALPNVFFTSRFDASNQKHIDSWFGIANFYVPTTDPSGVIVE